MELFWPIVSGVLLLIVSQLSIRFIFEPVQELRKAIGVVCYALIYYENVYSNPDLAKDLIPEARREFREAASLLISRALAIPIYGQVARFKMVPSRAAIKIDSNSLIGLSNDLDDLEKTDKRIEAIKDNLNLDFDWTHMSQRRPKGRYTDERNL